MSTIAADRYSTVAYPWLNFSAFSMLVDQRLRHRLAGLVMAREAIQHLTRQQPALVELRRQLHEIPRGSGQAAVSDVLQQAVHRVAELVEQRPGIVQRDQDRLARRALHEVVVVRRRSA